MTIQPYVATSLDLGLPAILVSLGFASGTITGIVIGAHIATGRTRIAHINSAVSGTNVTREIVREYVREIPTSPAYAPGIPTGPAYAPGIPVGPAHVSAHQLDRPEVTR